MVEQSTVTDALDNLRVHQRKLDADGCKVGVPRQALNDVIIYVGRLMGELAALKHDIERQVEVNAELATENERLREALSRTGAVKVKALEWEERKTRLGTVWWSAPNPLGGLSIEAASENDKIAAQADFEHRILSALEAAAPEAFAYRDENGQPQVQQTNETCKCDPAFYEYYADGVKHCRSCDAEWHPPLQAAPEARQDDEPVAWRVTYASGEVVFLSDKPVGDNGVYECEPLFARPVSPTGRWSDYFDNIRDAIDGCQDADWDSDQVAKSVIRTLDYLNLAPTRPAEQAVAWQHMPGCGEDRESKMVSVSEGAFCDPCIAPLVAALNTAGIETVASCCGHGHRPGVIALRDGRELFIAKDFDEARKIESIFPVDINGNTRPSERAVTEAIQEIIRQLELTGPTRSKHCDRQTLADELRAALKAAMEAGRHD